MTQDLEIKVALIDDHTLLRSALANMIDQFQNCKVHAQFSNGKMLIDFLEKGHAIDVVLLDLNMPEMDGFQTSKWLYEHYPDVKIAMLTMFDSEISLIRLLRNGVKGFLKKDISPYELKAAINSIASTGYYYSNHTTGRLLNLLKSNPTQFSVIEKSTISDREIEFLQNACSDLTYKEIAHQMSMNPRSIDTLRDHLFLKFDVRSRVGLALIAIKHGLVNI